MLSQCYSSTELLISHTSCLVIVNVHFVCRDGLLSTPAVSAVIRKREVCFGSSIN
jgi:phosphoglucomutase